MRSLLRISALTLLFTAIGLFGEPPQTPAPQLSTADKVALQSIQKTQTDAAKAWQDAEQEKLTVLREWQMDHPGFHVHYNPQFPNDPQNYSVEADGAPPMPPVKPTAPAKVPETPKK